MDVNRKSAPDGVLGNTLDASVEGTPGAQTNPILQVCHDISYEKANI